MKNMIKKTYLILFCCLGLASFSYGQFITPVAGSTTTVMPMDGDIFTDPTDGVTGGPGGDCTTTSSGNPGDYPNCGCITTTTLCAPAGQEITVTFTDFMVFGNFDWLAIFDGNGPVTATNGGGSATNPTSGDPTLFNSSVDGDDLAQMTGSTGVIFTSTSGCLTFAFRSSTVVPSCGWEATVTLSGGAPACPVGQSDVEITINTDQFGGETSWELRDMGGGILASAAVLASSSTIVTNVCVPCDQSPTAYTFEIFDTYGDGICCTFGNGSYTVTEDGNLVASGGAFLFNEATDFGTACAGGGVACDLNLTGIASTDESCFGDSDGTITITATTSNGPLTYSITGPVNQSNATGVFTGLPPGAYAFTVSDDAFPVPPGPACAVTGGPINIASDTQPPVITCPPNANVNCNNIPPTAGTVVDFIAAGGTATDNCTIASIAVAGSSVGDVCPNTAQQVIMYMYTLTDDSGNPANCTQTITVQNSTTGPVITSVPPNHIINCSYNAMPQLPLFDAMTDCGLGLSLSVSGATPNGTPNCPNSTIQYTYTAMDACGRTATHTQIYTIQNDGPEFVCPSELCIIECPENTDDIQTQFDDYAALATVNTSCNGSISISNNFNPNGFFNQNCNANPINGVDNVRRWQVVTFTATDQCNRTTSCTAMVIIVDNTPPVISGTANDAIRYCDAIANDQYNKWINETINGTATTGAPTLTASDACGTWSWSYSPSSPNTNCTGNPFTITEVTFTATDQCGNASSVTALFKLKEEPTANVSGGVYTEENEEVEHVEVSINQAGVGPMGSYMTGADGQFGFEVGIFGDYEVIPYRNDEPLNGVSTLDLIYISMHILGIDELDSPYQLIAADANNSGNITSADLVAIRKLILFMVEEFENNTSWRFVDEDFVFPDPTNPFATTFPELRNINSLTLTQLADFIAVKIGDVSGDATANQLAGTTGDTRSDQLTFNVTDQLLSAGERYTVDFKASDFTNVRGYQFSLNFDHNSLEFVDVQAGKLNGLTSDNFGFGLLNQGIITSSWNAMAKTNINNEAVLFSLVFKALTDGQLKNVLHLSSDYTKAEAYDSAITPMDLDLNFEAGKVDAHPFALYQNQPNPFRNETIIGFNLPEASEATLTIYDVAGRVIHQVKGAYATGYNQVNISKADISQSGVMYYTLETANNTATKKMILIANH